MDPLDNDDPDALMALGFAASAARDTAKAITCFEKACRSAPGAGWPRFVLGSEYAAQGAMDKAEASFAGAILLSPDLWIARYQLGLLQFSGGRDTLALLTWAPILQQPRTDALPHFVLGFAALAQDRLADALAHYRDGLAVEDTNPAVCDDIRKVVSGIERLLDVPTPSSDGGSPAASASNLDEARAQALLANYRRSGLPH